MIKRLALLYAAVAAMIYLVMSMTPAFASQISVFMPGGQKKTFQLRPEDLVSRTVEIVHNPNDSRWEKVLVKVGLAGTDQAYPIKKIYLFRCKNLNPSACAAGEPVEAVNYLSGEKGTFYWDDVSAGQVAGFLSLVEMTHNGRTLWIGFWDQVDREGLTTFRHRYYEAESVDVFAGPGADADWIASYMEEYFMAPMSWIDRIALGVVGGKVVEKTYSLGADAADLEGHAFTAVPGTGGSLPPANKTYAFAIGKGGYYSHPFTLFSADPAECGDGKCEALLGETQATCCADCGCDPNAECAVTQESPDGICHECGNGIIEQTETSKTCCVDAGCPPGTSCDESRDPPAGVCVLPSCGNGRCDSPEEGLGNCCTDCGGSAACASQMGAGYYCSPSRLACTLPSCPNAACEPGEDSSSCCADCSGCPAGQYCNSTAIGTGVCMPSSCGNGICEPSEDYASCCTDCSGCPADPVSGEQQACDANLCHLCGNLAVEPPAESESTCCQDTGCLDSGAFCSSSGACSPIDRMALSVSVIPESIDCRTGEKVKLRIRLTGKPLYFESFHSATYSFEGIPKLMSCTESGGFYECEIPTSGADIFPGCFAAGQKGINLTVNIAFYRDREDQAAGEWSTAAVRGSAGISVSGARPRTCNRNGICEAGQGETPDICCWDCGCYPGGVCTAAGCAGEGAIGLRIDGSSLTPGDRIACASGAGRVEFSASVVNVPHSAEEPFGISGWMLFYGTRNYTALSLPGFQCEAEAGTGGMLTGNVHCSVPVSVFPPCPYDPPALMSLGLSVRGGGLEYIYGPSGKPVNATFTVDYVKGLPRCGNGAIDDGETQDNCCRDAGCPGGRLCSLYSGCIDESQVGINLTITPHAVNCSRLTDSIVIRAEAEPKPLSFTGFDNTFLNRTRIDYFCGPDGSNAYAYVCTLPLASVPYCWEQGEKQISFETSLYYQNAGENKRKDIASSLSFTAIGSRTRQCDINGICQPGIGELPDICCADCGCTGVNNVCSFENKCAAKPDIALRVGTVGSVDCSGRDGYLVAFNATVQNQPHGITDASWKMVIEGAEYGQDLFSCAPRTNKPNVYECEISVYNLPLCHFREAKPMTLAANMTYLDNEGFPRSVYVSSPVSIQTRNWLESCSNPATGGNPACESALGETQATCCADCGCSSFGNGSVCTASGCKRITDVVLTLEPGSIGAECTLIPASVNLDRGRITGYECHFTKPMNLTAKVRNLPVHASEPAEMYFYLDGNASGKVQDFIRPASRNADGWKVSILPPFVSTATRSVQEIHKVKVGFTVYADDPGGEVVIPLESSNDVAINYSMKVSDDLVSIENQLKELLKAADKFLGYIYLISFVVGFCTPCFGLYVAYLGPVVALGYVGITVGFYGTMTAIGYSFMSTLDSKIKNGMTASASSFAGGMALLFAIATGGHKPFICAAITTPCLLGSVVAVLALMMMINKIKDAQEKIKNDIAKDMALAKTNVMDDLSFYYTEAPGDSDWSWD